MVADLGGSERISMFQFQKPGFLFTDFRKCWTSLTNPDGKPGFQQF